MEPSPEQPDRSKRGYFVRTIPNVKDEPPCSIICTLTQQQPCKTPHGLSLENDQENPTENRVPGAEVAEFDTLYLIRLVTMC